MTMFYKTLTYLYSVLPFRGKSQENKCCNNKPKVVCSWFLKLGKICRKNPEEESMQYNIKIYVWKIVLQEFDIKIRKIKQ